MANAAVATPEKAAPAAPLLATLRALAGIAVSAAISLIGLMALTFFIGRLLPIDPVIAIVGNQADQSTYDMVYRQLGLDRPLYAQFGTYLAHLAEGDLGRSYVQRTDVTTLVLGRLPATLWLLLGAVVDELAIGLPAGIVAAVRRGSGVDRSVMVLSFVGVSIPQFVLAIILLYVFAARLSWFPIGG